MSTTQKPARSAQFTMTASYLFNIGDTISNGVVPTPTTFVAGAATPQVLPAIKMPKGARVTGGAMTVTVVGNDSGAQTVAIGDTGSAARYLAATTIKSLARTVIVPTGFTSAGEDIQLTLVNTNGDATTGTVQVDIQYVIDGRGNEVTPN